MAVISADIFRLGVVQLTGAPPAVPTNPQFMLARLTGESLNFQPNTILSNELDPSGQVRDSILTGAQTTGSVDGELSRHAYFEDQLSAVFRNNWGTGTQGDGNSPAGTVPVGADQLIISDVLKLYEIEKRFVSPEGNDLFHRIHNSAVDTATITVSPGAAVTYSFAYSGGEMEPTEAAIAGATYPDPGTYPVFTAPEVQEISVGAVPMTLCFNSLTLNFASNVRGVECIGTLGFREQVLGRFEATIEGSAYFVDNELLDLLINQDYFPVNVELRDSLGNGYDFFYPRCKMSAGSVNAAGTGQDVVANVTIQALFDPSWNFSVRATRVHV